MKLTVLNRLTGQSLPTFYMAAGDLNSVILACLTSALTPSPILGYLVKVKRFVLYKKLQLKIPQELGMVAHAFNPGA